MLVYSTTTGLAPVDPQGYLTPEPIDFPAHTGCVHSIGFCADAEWD